MQNTLMDQAQSEQKLINYSIVRAIQKANEKIQEVINELLETILNPDEGFASIDYVNAKYNELSSRIEVLENG